MIRMSKSSSALLILRQAQDEDIETFLMLSLSKHEVRLTGNFYHRTVSFRAGTNMRRLASLLFVVMCLAAVAAHAYAAEIDPALVAAAKKEGRVTFYTPLIVDQMARPLTA